MATLAAVIVQDLTYTEKQLGLGVQVSYTNTGTAGSEVVSVTKSTNNWLLSVAIESGVSTATQIKAAVDASADATRLVTVTVSGTGSNVQLSCVSAPLAGGVAVASATLTVGGVMLLTADTAGTAGNDVRFRFTSGGTAGAEVVTVSTNDISVEIEDGVSTYDQVKTAIEAEGAAAALVDVSSAGKALSNLAYVASASAYVALSGGVAATAASVIVQDLTYSGDLSDTSKNGSTISYTTGATAGSEVVSVSGQNVSVQIENGVSTATQIKTAFDASAAADGAAATATVTVLDYANGNLTAASGTVTVVDYTDAGALTASGTVTVVDYTKLAIATATCSGVITYGTPNDGSTVIITNLPSGGSPVTFTKVASSPGPLQFAAITDLTALINTLTNLNATDDGTDITVTAATAGTTMNAVTITGTSSYVALSRTFSGGQNHAVLTVNGTALTEGTDWDAETNDDTTAANLEVAIEAVAGISSSATGDAITVSSASAGAAGNAITLATSDAVNLTISGATLSGGRNATTVTINGTALVANVDWTAETSNDVTAANLETAIEAVTGINSSAASAVITVTAATPGAAGNALTLATSFTDAVTVSGATLAGGINALVITVNGTAVTEGTDFNAETNNNTTATNLAVAIAALSGVGAAAVGPVVTITNDAEGTVGNAKTLTTSSAPVASVSGATFSGGTDAWAVAVSGTGSTAQVTVNAAAPTGAVGDGADAFYADQATITTTTSFQRLPFGFVAHNLVVENNETSGTDTLVISFDGVNTHGTLTFGEELNVGDVNLTEIWVKYTNAEPDYRITALP